LENWFDFLVRRIYLGVPDFSIYFNKNLSDLLVRYIGAIHDATAPWGLGTGIPSIMLFNFLQQGEAEDIHDQKGSGGAREWDGDR